jgi:peptide/nickel transport system ATP-binding protein
LSWGYRHAVNEPLLTVNNLRVGLNTSRGPADALRGVSFSVRRGETVGLIGESGCGKSMTALVVMGLLPPTARVSGSIQFGGQELVGANEDTLCQLRGNRIGMIFQEPMTALNPLHTVGAQVAEPLRQHRGMGRSESRAEALRLLDQVRLPQAAQRLDAYPHQLSGGQRQRVMIAAALACGPDLLIADEPTTALDATIQGEILELLSDLVTQRHMALLLISHDLGVMAQTVQRVMVMYGGMVVESGPTASVFERLAHPYTRGLFGARPSLGAARVNGVKPRLVTIAGRVPELVDLPAGCGFADRCERVERACREAIPEAVSVAAEHDVVCIKPHGPFPLSGGRLGWG